MCLCQFCNKECKNENSLRNHERLCSLNPNKQKTHFDTDEFKIQRAATPCNQFIKAKKNGISLGHTDTVKKLLSEQVKQRGKEWHQKNGERISKTISDKVSKNEWHTSLARHMHIDYNGVDLHGSWELKYAQYLDKHKIEWVRNKDSFSYFYNGKDRKYTPDFYLPQTDEYIEIKGYRTAKDSAKWEQFPKHRKLVVLLKKELETLLGVKL